jgi:hypothetical protein
MFVLRYQAQCLAKLFSLKPEVLRELDLRFQPEFRLPVLPVDMNVHPRFFTRKEYRNETRLLETPWGSRTNGITFNVP